MKNLAKFIDQTNIKTEATAQDIKNTCQEAKDHGFRGVCVYPKWVKLVSGELAGTGIKTVVLIDPPMGLSSHTQRISRRLEICQKAKKDGADDLDVVMNIVDLKHERYNKILKDLTQICKLLPTKVIIGSGFLTDDEVKKASEIVKAAGAFCVKIATSKDPLEEREIDEKIRHLQIMAKAAPGLLIKASGNIKTKEEVEKAIKAGANIVGTSSGVMIVKK